MADTKLTALSAGTPALASLVYGVDDPAGSPVSVKYTLTQLLGVLRSGLTFTAGGADADQAMAVNTLYYVDISGYSADRTYTLPATAAVGDICAITLTAGDTAFELIITANTGDTLNGVAGGTEWSRLFITGETVYMMCVAANSAWIPVVDGRIPAVGVMRLSTQADGETANTVSLPTDFGGAWTVDTDNCSMSDTSTGRFTLRRTNPFLLVANGQSKDTVADQRWWAVIIVVSGTETIRDQRAAAVGTANLRATAIRQRDCTEGEYIQMAFASLDGLMGCRALANVQLTIHELL